MSTPTTSLYSTYETLEIIHRPPILDVRLNRPEARNAMTFQMDDELDQILDEAEDDPEIRAVTIRGNGPIFCAGHDLKEVASGYRTEGVPSGMPRSYRRPRMPRAWYFKKPLLAGVHGYVGPMANHFIAGCDFVIAAEGTRFSFEQTRMGGGAAGGTILNFQLPMRVDMDYVQRVVPLAELDAETDRWAIEASKIPSQQYAAAKEMIHRVYEIRGLVGIAMIENKVTGHGSAEDRKFFEMVQERGMKEALKYRDSQYDQSVAEIV
jgi:enoyl-CoA hydratase/carnithine racemase